MANTKDFIVKNAVEVGGDTKVTVGTSSSGSVAAGLDSASYDSVSFSVASQDSDSNSFYIKPDGTKFWIVGNSNNSVYQYAMSTAWDLSTASYESKSFNVGSQDNSPYGLSFKSDGTKMYMVGTSTDTAYQYTLSTAWDVSTASYDSVSFSVSSQDTTPYTIVFKPDGTKFWMTGGSGNDVNEYTLSTAWDLSTASFSQNASFTSQETTPLSATFNYDGTKMYIVGYTSDTVFEYDLSTAYDISTATYNSVSFSVASEDGAPYMAILKSDSTKMYVIGGINNTIYQYSTSDPTQNLDLSTGNYFSHTPTSDLQYTFSNPADVQSFQLEVTSGASGYYDISNLISEQNITLQSNNRNAVSFKPDGTKMFTVGNNPDEVEEYNLSTPWDISTATYSQVTNVVTTYETLPTALFFKPDGTKMYVTGTTGDDVNEFSLSTAWDVSTASYQRNFAFGVESLPNGLFFKPDGTKMYVVGFSGDDINEWNLTTAWNVSSATSNFVGSKTLGNAEDPKDLFFKPDGSSVFIVEDTGTVQLHEFPLTTAWSVSSLQEFGGSTTVTLPSGITSVEDVFFKPDGSKMYLVANGNQLYQFPTTTAPTITWSSAIQWAGGTAPTSPALGEKDTYTFMTDDTGTSYIGFQSGDAFS